MKSSCKKLVAFDLDGTLLNDSREISEENREALKALADNGYEIVLASGRPEILMRAHYLTLPFVRYVISSNGGMIRDVIEGKEVYSIPIPSHAVEKVVEICDKREVGCDFYSFYGMEHLPTKDLDKEITDEIFLAFKTKILKDREMMKFPCEKMFLTEEHPERLKELWEELEKEVPEIEITQSSFQALDLMAKGCHKGAALKKIAEYLEVDRECVFAFGDHLNDKEMLQYAGTSLVCSNAVDFLKDKVSHVLPETNDENGIAKGIYRYILKIEEKI